MSTPPMTAVTGPTARGREGVIRRPQDPGRRGIVVMVMSPILADGLRPVGGTWPAGHKRRFGLEGKGEVEFGRRIVVGVAAMGAGSAFLAPCASLASAIQRPRRFAGPDLFRGLDPPGLDVYRLNSV